MNRGVQAIEQLNSSSSHFLTSHSFFSLSLLSLFSWHGHDAAHVCAHTDSLPLLTGAFTTMIAAVFAVFAVADAAVAVAVATSSPSPDRGHRQHMAQRHRHRRRLRKRV